MKQFRMLVIGLITGVMLTISASAFAAGSVSKIEAYLREGFTFKVNGQVVTLQNTPIVYQDTSYMPVRELATMLGYEVGFEDNTITLDAKTPPLSAVEQRKDVDDVTTVTEPQTIDVDLSEWVSLDELRQSHGVEYSIGLPEGEPATSENRVYKVIFNDKIEVFIIPRISVGDYIVTNDSGNKLLTTSGGRYINKSLANDLIRQ